MVKLNSTLLIIIFLFGRNGTMAQKRCLFLIAGQSNAVGMGDSTQSVKGKIGSALEYRFSDNSLVPLKDPVGANELDFEKAQSGSIAPAFAEKFNQLSGKQVIIVSAARGGSSCHKKAELDRFGTWDIDGKYPLFDKAIEKTKKAIQKTNLPLRGIIWLQGERDANAINAHQLTPEEYQQSLENLIGRFRNEFGKKVPFYIILTGFYTDHPIVGFEKVRQIQESIAQKMKNTYIVYRETNTFKAKDWMKDLIHYNQTGLNDIGEKIAEEIFKK